MSVVVVLLISTLIRTRNIYKNLLHEHKLDLFVGTESYLDVIVLSSEIFASHYTTYENDRNQHGGNIFVT